MKLAIFATHPIQYHAPLFRELAKRDGVELTVYFYHRPTPAEQGKGFGLAFEWDVDLLSGYQNFFLKNVARNPTNGFWGYDTPEINNIIRREHFDFIIVHGWFNKASWQIFFASWWNGIKVGVRSDSQLPQGHIGFGQKIKTIIKKVVYPLFIRRFNLCLPYGQRSAEYFKFFSASRIAISPHFVDINFFSSEASQRLLRRSELRSQWQIPSQAICFLFCGKLQAVKRPLDILKALKIVVHRGCGNGKKIHLLMVGDGKMLEDCQAFVKMHNLPVTFAGFLNQKEIPSAYAVSDCLLLSSDSETWGLVVNEAMACKMPVIISSTCGCTPDLIIEGETGYSFPCGNVEVLADRMLLMATDRKRLHTMGEQAYLHVSAYNVGHAADTLLEALNGL